MFSAGSRIELSYPDSTLVESLAKLRRRRVRVCGVRDLVREPLTPEEFVRRPFIRRSRWLITGYDLDRRQYRQFYAGSSGEYRSPGLLRVALYEPGADRPTWPFPRPYGPTRRERALLVHCLREWLSRDLADLQLRIYCDDLAVYRGEAG